MWFLLSTLLLCPDATGVSFPTIVSRLVYYMSLGAFDWKGETHQPWLIITLGAMLQVLPEAPWELVAELSRRYITLYEKITGQAFHPATAEHSPSVRICNNISIALNL